MHIAGIDGFIYLYPLLQSRLILDAASQNQF